jgi:NAD(P)-dependent dehydrogenase (short-subunit alcohol dehydrogenase family)
MQICIALDNAGYEVHALVRNRETSKGAVSHLQRSNITVHDYDQALIATDDKGLPPSLIGEFYGLINNAAICEQQSLKHSTRETWDRLLATNLSGVYHLTRLLLPQISKGGRILNISSQLGLEGRAEFGAYCASKFGLIGLTKTWAKELGAHKITVNAICPGWVETEMTHVDINRIAEKKGISAAAYREDICRNIELGEMNRPTDVADLAVFLLSERAARISGRDWLMHNNVG